MADLEQQLGAMLSNPQLMNQLFQIANTMGAPQQPVSQQPAPPQQNAIPFDPASIRRVTELMKQTQLEPRQQELLRALGSYLPSDRIQRLQKAMQAAKIARFASAALSDPGWKGR